MRSWVDSAGMKEKRMKCVNALKIAAVHYGPKFHVSGAGNRTGDLFFPAPESCITPFIGG
jgi:hypothetical protein